MQHFGPAEMKDALCWRLFLTASHGKSHPSSADVPAPSQHPRSWKIPCPEFIKDKEPQQQERRDFRATTELVASREEQPRSILLREQLSS